MRMCVFDWIGLFLYSKLVWIKVELSLHEYYEDANRLIGLASSQGDISFVKEIASILQKNYIICCASCFEASLTSQLLKYIETKAGLDSPLLSFVQNKAISRQFHTWFNWDGNNANHFFGLFGKNFLSYMKQQVKDNCELDQSIRSFLSLGRQRNELAHGNLIHASCNTALEEAYKLANEASLFVDSFTSYLDEFAFADKAGRQCSQDSRHSAN